MTAAALFSTLFLLADLPTPLEEVWSVEEDVWYRPDELISFSPDGSLLVCRGKGGGLTVRRVEDGAVLRTLEFPSEFFGFAFLEDGRAVSACNGEVRTWDRGLASSRPAGLSLPGRVFRLAASGDGTRVAAAGAEFGNGEGPRWVLRFRGGVDRDVYSEDPFDDLSATADGERVVARNGDGTVRFFDWSGRETAVVGGEGPGRVKGDLRLTTCGPGRTAVVSRAFGHPSDSDPVVADRVTAFREDGVRAWGLPAGGAAGRIYSAAVSPDGTRVATAGGVQSLPNVQQLAVYSLPDMREVAVRRRFAFGGGADYWAVRFTPDGRHLAALGGRGVTLFRSPATEAGSAAE